MKRRHVIIVLSILIVAISFLIYKNAGADKEKGHKKNSIEKQTRLIQVDTVKLSKFSPKISITGTIKSRNDIEIYAETGGLFNYSAHPFQKGNSYKKGEVLVGIDQKDEILQLVGQRNKLFNSITKLIPDLVTLFPERVKVWEEYLNKFNEHNNIPELPSGISQKERYYLSANNVLGQFYDIKSAEEKMSRFTITAPFPGFLAEASVQEGELVRAGQKLGRLLGTTDYELETAISLYDISVLNINDEVALQSTAVSSEISGKIARISQQVDEQTQMVWVAVKVKGKGLFDGMFVEGEVAKPAVDSAFTFDRSLLIDKDFVFKYDNGTLKKVKVQIHGFNENKVIVTGLSENTLLLAETSPTFIEGMKVRLK